MMNRTKSELACILRKVTSAMLPLYEAISHNERFASIWCKSVRKANLSRLEKLLRVVSPTAAKESIGTNGIGYFISFSAPKPFELYMNGTTIPPGDTQFTFDSEVHRAMSRDLISLYEALAKNESFTDAFALAILRNEHEVIQYMIKSLVTPSSLQSISIQDYGVVMTFKYPSSKYRYRNLLLCEQL